MSKQAPCLDCGKDTEPRRKNGKPDFRRFDLYLVRDEVWAEAGMKGWNSGYLCTLCLSKRLGRELTADDYLVRAEGVTSEGLQMVVHPDYLKHHSVKGAHE